jgi:hypothetical protein
MVRAYSDDVLWRVVWSWTILFMTVQEIQESNLFVRRSCIYKTLKLYEDTGVPWQQTRKRPGPKKCYNRRHLALLESFYYYHAEYFGDEVICHLKRITGKHVISGVEETGIAEEESTCLDRPVSDMLGIALRDRIEGLSRNAVLHAERAENHAQAYHLQGQGGQPGKAGCVLPLCLV